MTDPRAQSEVSARLELAQGVAADVRRLTLKWFQNPALRSERKSDGSIVTPIDREAEQIIRDAVARCFADDAILGEEFGEVQPERGSGFRWIVDPIDGTASFVRGIPHFVTLIGIEWAGDVVAGLIDAPALGERLSASRGNGVLWTLRNGQTRQARVSKTTELRDAHVELGPFRAFDRHGLGELHHELCMRMRRSRGWSDGYAFALLATGRIDAAVHLGFKPWDLAGPMIVVEEAGGRLTDWTGKRSVHITRPLASNAALHDELTKLLNEGSWRD